MIMSVRPCLFCLTLCCAALAAAVARAGDGNGLSMGGGWRPMLGMADPHGGAMGNGLHLGSLPGLSGDEGRLAVTVQSGPSGGVMAGLTGSASAEAEATRYGLYLGAVWAGDRFSLSSSGTALTNSPPDTAGKGDVSMTITLNHPLTPNLSLIGMAAAHRGVIGGDGTNGPNNSFLLGAGLGLQF